MRNTRFAGPGGPASLDAARLYCVEQHRSTHAASWESLAARIAPTNCAILITGETGCGKGFAARRIHERSERKARPFVPVNCGAIPESLIDSHLFGHAKGAFSGADREHDGLVRAAEGGTLLLDEIADLPLTSQSRLLRLLEEREVQPVGYSHPVKVNVRIIAATSADLDERVRAGMFRQDLLFRLDVVRLQLPSLRERRTEIVPLLTRFNDEFAALYRQPAIGFDAAAIRMIDSHDWPGNVRELRTVVERLHVLCGREATLDATSRDHDVRAITVDDLIVFGGLPASRHGARNANRPSASVQIAELKLESVNSALVESGGSMTRAASVLGVHRSTLYRWLQAHQRISA